MHEQEQPPIPAELPPSEAFVMEKAIAVTETEAVSEPEVEPAPETPLEAVQGADRLEIIDVLRGLCLLGILAANMRGHNAAELIYFDINRWFSQPYDKIAQTFVSAFIQGKFISIFSFLFGLGFAVQFTRGMERGKAVGGWFGRNLRLALWLCFAVMIAIPLASQLVYGNIPKLPKLARVPLAFAVVTAVWALYQLRFRQLTLHDREFTGYFSKRLLLLYGLGWLHVSLLWWGDVLTQYATAGFMLLAFRNARLKTVAIWGWVMTTIPIAGITGFAIYSVFRPSPPPKPLNLTALLCKVDSINWLYSTGSVWDLIDNRVRAVWAMMPFMTLGVSIGLMPCFLLGLWVWKKGIVHNMSEWLPKLKRVWLWLLPVALFYWTFGFLVPSLVEIPRGQATMLAYLRELSRNALSQLVALFYVLSFVLAVQRPGVWSFLRPCGAIGRLSLSNYLLQSLIGVLLFTSTGLAFFGHGIFLYGKIGPLLDLPITLVIYLAQIPLSQWYLRHYRIGPVEWLWRSLSYGEPQRFRR